MNKYEIQKAFGKKVRKFRLLSCKSQEEFAYTANVSAVYLGAVERGEKCASIYTLCKISEALKIPPAELLDFGNDDFDTEKAFLIVKSALLTVPENKRLAFSRVFESLARAYAEDK